MKRFIMIAMLFLLLFPLPAQRKNKSKQVQSENRIFSDLDKEYKLVSYFLNYQQKKYYHSLKDETEQSAYLASFWKAYNPNPISKKNDFLILIRERIAYCNTRFSNSYKNCEGLFNVE